jgi:hypothetical protein
MCVKNLKVCKEVLQAGVKRSRLSVRSRPEPVPSLALNVDASLGRRELPAAERLSAALAFRRRAPALQM